MKAKPTCEELERELEILKRSEKELQSERYLLNLLMDTMPDRIYFKNLKSQFLKINKSLAKRHGLDSPEEAVGKTDFDFFTNEHAQKAFLDEQKIMNTGRLLKDIEEKETWHDGEVTWASTTKMPMIDGDGKIIGTFGISRDITDRKEARQALTESELQLKELNATKDKFFSIIAHDLKSPFSSILGLSELLFTNFDKYDAQKKKRFIGLIKEATENTYKLLENLLLWSRSQRGIIDFKPTKRNLHLLTGETVNLLSQSTKNKSIVLINQIPEDIYVVADRDMLLTILRNLISNAIKFTHKNGMVIVSVEKTIKQKFIEISVTDTGIGISEDTIGDLFQLDKNVSTSGTEKETGTGLGLILCKEFVEKHGGEIWIESKVGKGSKFIFTLPVE